MKLAPIRGFCLVLSIGTAVPAFAQGTLFGSSRNGELFAINVTTGAGTLVGVIDDGAFLGV